MTGAEIRALRESLCISVSVLAGILRCTRGRLYEWELQARVPSQSSLALLELIERQRDAWIESGRSPAAYGDLLRLRGNIPSTLPPPPPPQTPDRGQT